jgi:ssDNA thymidine ADP-ribosyltransferase, DarT
VLRVSCDVLDLPGAIVADGNASSDYTRFLSSPEGLSAINEEIAFMGDPRHPDQVERWRRTREQCAEVLVPERIPSQHVEGLFVSCAAARDEVQALDLAWTTTVDPSIFFQ